MAFTRAILLVVFVVVFQGLQVQAARYAVVYKDRAVVLKIQSWALLSPDKPAISQIGGVPIRTSRIDSVIPGLNTIIYNSEDDLKEALRGHKEVRTVVKEYFRPLPTPVGGFKPSQPWDFAVEIRGENLNIQRILSVERLDRPYGINMIKAPKVWPATSLGKGSKVLVLDTGIDVNHPAYRSRLLQVRNFIAEQDQLDVTDKEGHGTHVAGTILASLNASGFSGVAPDAALYAGKVCSDEGCSNIAVAEGIAWAIDRKVHVINLSLGGAEATEIERLAIEKAEAAGIAVVAASGNSGTDSVSYPAAFAQAIAVGAVGADEKRGEFSQFGPELDLVAPGVDIVSTVPRASGRDSQVAFTFEGQRTLAPKSKPLEGSAEDFEGKTAEVVYAGLGRAEDYQNLDVAGKVVLVKRGEIGFLEKVNQALGRDAIAMVIVNTEDKLISGSLGENGSEDVLIPVVMIEKTQGDVIIEALQKKRSVTSTVRTIATDYSSLSGTSMAAPHVTGVVALMFAANPKLTPAQVRQILAATTKPLGPNVKNEFGRGLIDAEKAVMRALELAKN